MCIRDRKEKVDGVLAYASDPAAPTAAYVGEKLKLPTNPYYAVDIPVSYTHLDVYKRQG